MSAATCETAPRVRPERKTVAPWSANSLATAVPTAPPAPKMTARLFFNKDVDVDAVFIRLLPFNACSREQFIFLLRSRNQAADRGVPTDARMCSTGKGRSELLLILIRSSPL